MNKPIPDEALDHIKSMLMDMCCSCSNDDNENNHCDDYKFQVAFNLAVGKIYLYLESLNRKNIQ